MDSKMKLYKKYFLFTLIGTLFLFCGCGKKATHAPPKFESYLFSFENGMEGWEKRATDLELGDTLIEWSIERTQEMAQDGTTAVKLYLENWNDAGKIWIERPFAVKQNQPYLVEVKYAFASADFGFANLWTIITGVVQGSPQTREDLVYQGHTGNGYQTDVGFKWLQKSYDFDVISDSKGLLYVIIGVWGTWETPRTYYLDSVYVAFTQK